MARLRRSDRLRYARGRRRGLGSARTGAPRGARARPRLVARAPHLLRLALSRRGNDRRVRRQGIGTESHPADEGRRALFGGVVGAQVHEAVDLAADDARCGEGDRAGQRAHLAPRGHGGARAHRRRPSAQVFSRRTLRQGRAGRDMNGEGPSRAANRAPSGGSEAVKPRAGVHTRLPELFSLDGHVALVTGASSGIGRAIATTLAEAGARVVLVARREAELEDARKAIAAIGGQAAILPCDLGNRDALARCADSASRPFGAPDIVVNSAGINIRKPMLELSADDWDRTMRVNLEAPFFLSQRL